MTSIKKRENIKEEWNISGKKKKKKQNKNKKKKTKTKTEKQRERDNIKVEGIEVIDKA